MVLVFMPFSFGGSKKRIFGMKFGSFSKMFFGVILSLIAVCIFPDLIQASTWRVERDGSGDFTTIQPAVDGAAPGDTILVGPGDYIESASVVIEGWSQPTDVFVNVTVADLTFIGTSSDEVRIGPDEFYSTYQGPVGFSYGNMSGTLRIENVSILNVGKGSYSHFGRLEAVGCVFENIKFHGTLSLSPNGLFVDQCSFVGLESEYAILTFPPCTGVVIQNCEFVNGDISLNSASDVVMENCTSFDDGQSQYISGGIQLDNCDGRISHCEFTGHKAFCVAAIGGSNVQMENCTLIADGYVNSSVGLHAWSSSNVDVSNCIIEGTFSSFYIRSNAQVTVDSCHINTTGLWSVYADSYGGPPIDMDFTNNYWGTIETDLIDSKILDSNDDSNLSLTIIYDPIIETPIPTEKPTLGGFRAMYR